MIKFNDIIRTIKVKLSPKAKGYLSGDKYLKIFRSGKNIVVSLNGEHIFSGSRIHKILAENVERELINKKKNRNR